LKLSDCARIPFVPIVNNRLSLASCTYSHHFVSIFLYFIVTSSFNSRSSFHHYHRHFVRWRDANIVLLFKKDERHLASNYRPVSLISITCKILHGAYSPQQHHGPFRQKQDPHQCSTWIPQKTIMRVPTHSNHP
jgi:hypothetical protein